MKLKFKALYNVEKKMYPVISFDTCEVIVGSVENPDIRWGNFKRKDCVIFQDTGLKDKNGKEIYEREDNAGGDETTD